MYDLKEFMTEVRSLPTKKEQTIRMHEHGFTNAEITSLTGATRNSVDWYISKHKKVESVGSGRTVFEADKAMTRLHNDELKKNRNAS